MWHTALLVPTSLVCWTHNLALWVYVPFCLLPLAPSPPSALFPAILLRFLYCACLTLPTTPLHPHLEAGILPGLLLSHPSATTFVAVNEHFQVQVSLFHLCLLWLQVRVPVCSKLSSLCPTLLLHLPVLIISAGSVSSNQILSDFQKHVPFLKYNPYLKSVLGFNELNFCGMDKAFNCLEHSRCLKQLQSGKKYINGCWFFKQQFNFSG